MEFDLVRRLRRWRYRRATINIAEPYRSAPATTPVPMETLFILIGPVGLAAMGSASLPPPGVAGAVSSSSHESPSSSSAGEELVASSEGLARRGMVESRRATSWRTAVDWG